MVKISRAKTKVLTVSAATICLIVIVYFLNIETFYNEETHIASLQDADALSTYPRAQTYSDFEGGAFVFLALGVQANTLTCPAAIESLVKIGGWGGHVYMITDRNECFEFDEIVANAGMLRDRFHLVSTGGEEFGKGGFDSKSGLRASRVRSFGMKTRIFDFISDQRITTVVYADCDILFTQPDCPHNLITQANDTGWVDSKIKFMHFHRSIINSTMGKIIAVHAGSFVAHREHSKHLLKSWEDAIASKKYDGDMTAFMSIYGTETATDYDPSKLTRAEEIALKFPGPEPPSELLVDPSGPHEFRNWYEKFFHPRFIRCMCHISKARCNMYGRDVVQQFVDKLRLDTLKNGEKYCVSPILEPLLYGWFPISYVPFCPKLEHIL